MPYCHLYVIALVYVLYKFIKLWQNKDVIVINTLLSLLFRRKRIPYFFTLLLISLQLFWGEVEGGGISRFPQVPTCTSFFLCDLNHATLENESPRKWNLHGIRCNCMMVLSSNKKNNNFVFEFVLLFVPLSPSSAWWTQTLLCLTKKTTLTHTLGLHIQFCFVVNET